MIRKIALLNGLLAVMFQTSFANEFPSIKEEINSSIKPRMSFQNDGDTNKANVDPERMSNYRIDSCNVRYDHVTNENELRANKLRRCKDGTVSFVQPPSEGWWGSEGKCGRLLFQI